MKKANASGILAFAALILCLFFPTSSQAARKHGMGIYDPATVETVRGEVVSIEGAINIRGAGTAQEVTVRNGEGDVSVHLGPKWYLQRNSMEIVLKDRIEVTGSRITYEGRPVILASEVKRGQKRWMLRDSLGIPAWAGIKAKDRQ